MPLNCAFKNSQDGKFYAILCYNKNKNRLVAEKYQKKKKKEIKSITISLFKNNY